jgi:hypothetical protein
MDTSVTVERLKLIPFGRRELMLRRMYSQSDSGVNTAIAGGYINRTTVEIANRENALRVAIVRYKSLLCSS